MTVDAFYYKSFYAIQNALLRFIRAKELWLAYAVFSLLFTVNCFVLYFFLFFQHWKAVEKTEILAQNAPEVTVYPWLMMLTILSIATFVFFVGISLALIFYSRTVYMQYFQANRQTFQIHVLLGESEKWLVGEMLCFELVALGLSSLIGGIVGKLIFTKALQDLSGWQSAVRTARASFEPNLLASLISISLIGLILLIHTYFNRREVRKLF